MPGALHHIMVRGLNKTAIFVDAQDRGKFLERLGEGIVAAESSVYAWALMKNHVHILFASGKSGISEVMRKLLTWYAMYFNRRYGRTGHLFENRYKSILCEEDEYLLVLVRYIHLNPVRAGIVRTMEELEKYPWCGHGAVLGALKCGWMDTDYVLAQFGSRKGKAREAYRGFVAEGMGMGRRKELTGGGLIRSLGGWSRVLSMHRRGEQEESDARILGGGDFVGKVLAEAEAKELRQLKFRRLGKKIEDIMEEECAKGKVSVKELKAGGRRAKVSRVRALIAVRGVEELGLTAAEIARNVGIGASSVTRAIAKSEK